MAFAKQKLQEVAILTRAVNEGTRRRGRRAGGQPAAVESRRTSAAHPQPGGRRRAWPRRRDDAAAARIRFAERREAQRRRLALPLLPTTTIGSFPQTGEVRKARAALEEGQPGRRSSTRRSAAQEIERTVRFQEEIDLDVLVHGEFERNDMVEYFGEQLEGFALHRATAGCRATARAA